ncbi:MAG: GDP-L-fucose synthase family protein [Alphaproteobacteria bacterium]
MDKTAKIYVAGHRGLAGSAIVRNLKHHGYENILLKTSQEMDLRHWVAVEAFFVENRPEYVFLAAARVGGIHANDTLGGEFIRDNLLIQTHVMEAARLYGCQKLIFLGSSCIYPKMAPQPLKEEYLLQGALETTNEPYAIAKIAGLKMLEAYRKQFNFSGITLMPTNLYGYGDNFDLQNGHVLAALLRKFHEAKINKAHSVTVWGSGAPKREFLFADDLAEACIFLAQHYDSSELINVGVGEDISIADLARLIAGVVGFRGEIEFDPSMPDGTPRKLLDVSKIQQLGWKAKVPLEDGIRKLYEFYTQQ